ncbi:hypothetical protein GGI13_003190 [Coemansia sp. RSA 455]|nr:hypothetical protein GGI13_003190 [Coemansia sp. RSA 455]
MYDTSRKPSSGTCASTASQTSSPLTPGMDAPPPEPHFAEYDRQSATLDSIGAWSTVQPNPNQPPATDDHSYGFGTDVCSLSNKYNAMRLDQSQPPRPAPPSASTETTFLDDGGQRDYMRSAAAHAQAQAHAADVDYTELDEAILRGRSTTLPNIFSVPNPPYRLSAVASSSGMDSSALAGPISPVSNSTFSMLSRHGSMSMANSIRTVSPLGLPLNANPIHQSASLDNHFPSTFDLMHSAPIKRFSEFSAEPNSSLALASYSMAAHFPSGGDTTDGTNTSGASHGVTGGRPAFVATTNTSNVSSLPVAPINAGSGSISAMDGSLSNARCEGSVYHQPAASTRYGSFGYHLPTMREEESPSAPLSPPTFADSVLMRNMSFSAMPLPSTGESAAAAAAAAVGGLGDSSRFMSNGMTSPLGMRGSGLAPGAPSVATESQPARGNGANVSYLPLRVKSMKNLRRPSLDTRSDYAHASAADDQVAGTYFERAAELQSSMPLNHLSGLGRRHSVSTSNLGVQASTSAAHSGTGAAPPPTNGLSLDRERGGGVSLYYAAGNGGEYSVYPHFAHPGTVPQVHGFAPTMRPYGAHPGQYPSQHQYHPFALGSAPITRVAGVPSANNGPVGPGMYGAHMHGAMVPHPYPFPYMAYQAQYHHHHHPQMAPGSAAHLTEHLPSLIQPVPLATPSQSQQQQYFLPQQHHMRRGSHPAISSIGAAAPSNSAVHSGSHPQLSNPAKTTTSDNPYFEMGKGLAYSSLPKGTRVFVVEFKRKRCDMYFAPSKDLVPEVIPPIEPLDPNVQPRAALPHEAAARLAASRYELGTYVLVEADRGFDLGLIKGELVTAESILSFSSSLPEAICVDPTTSSDTDCAAEHAGPTRSKPAPTDGAKVSSSSSSKDVFVKRILCSADQSEVDDLINKVKDEQKALSMCQDKVRQLRLSMHIADAEFQFDRRKVTFYFTAPRRVDFRDLVRNHFKHYKTRIWMYQLTH